MENDIQIVIKQLAKTSSAYLEAKDKLETCRREMQSLQDLRKASFIVALVIGFIAGALSVIIGSAL